MDEASSNMSRVSRFPVDRPYVVLDPTTGLVHSSQAYDDGSHFHAGIVHATRCDIEPSTDWPMLSDREVITCITCMAGK